MNYKLNIYKRKFCSILMPLFVIFLIINNSPTIAKTENNIQETSLPSSFSWQNINGTDYTTSIKDQAPAPTCEAYALCAALETLVQYKVGYPFECDLSEIHLFFYPGGNIQWGVHVVDAANYLIEHGVPDEGCSPDPHRSYEWSYESVDGWENRTIKIKDWGWVYNNIESIKQALIEHGPLIICIIVWTDFIYYKSGVYTPKWWSKIEFGHVITLVGYDDNEECWIVRNSAGKDWGEDGYARVSYYAHNPRHPFFWPFYGGTGIMYIDGVYGNLIPDVPRIYIEHPKRHNTYIFGIEIPTILNRLSFIQTGVPRVLGKLNFKVNATNTQKVEFYLDDELLQILNEPPFELKIDASSGLHTIETHAYKDRNISKDITDVYFF